MIKISEFFGPNPSGTKYSVFLKPKEPSKTFEISEPGALSLFSFKAIFKTVFLPEGFPYSVSDDYVPYQKWDTLQAFCSSISGALAARAMFETLGVGDASATIYGATLTWLIKDGTGMVGRILFAWSKGSSFDSNCKMWRLYADLLNDFSFLIDMITPFFSRWQSIYFCSFSSLLRSLVGVAGGATRSALTQHQAINNNLADVSAKDSSQETLVNLVALVFNILLFSYIQDSKMIIWLLFFIFVFGHILANYLAVKSVVMKTFNHNRFSIVCKEFLLSGRIFSPKIANINEPVFWTVKEWKIDQGISIQKMRSNQLTSENMTRLSQQHYLISFDVKNRAVTVLYESKVSLMDQIKCLLQIKIVEHINEANLTGLEKLKIAISKNDPVSIEKESFLLAERNCQEFIAKCGNEGWCFNYAQFSLGQYRYSLDKCE